ncbi:MAG TPA: glycosyltransferase [Candidatus Micrarchaeia archaeon]|nr:glycosyltransferase [Candidatus Micrarchaeia archaeon]
MTRPAPPGGPGEPGLVSVVLANWNGAAHAARCLAALRAQSHRPVEVLVVDNGSQDGSGEWWAAQPGVRCRRNPVNRGFAQATNQGIAASRGEFVCLCNVDAELGRDFLARAVARLRARPLAGSVAGRLRRPAGPGGSAVLDSCGHGITRAGWAYNIGAGEPDDGRLDAAVEVFGASAAAAVYRRSLLQDVAVAGEVLAADFFAYQEDVDLDWRARWRGWEAWYEPLATAVHHRGGSGGWRTAAVERHLLANRLLLLVRNADGDTVLRRDWPAIALFTGLRWGRAVGRRPGAVGALGLLVRHLPAAVRARRAIRARRVVPASELDGWLEPTPWRRWLGSW